MPSSTVFLSLGTDELHESSRKGWTYFRCFVGGWLALTFLALMYSTSHNSEPVMMNAVGFSGARLASSRANTRGFRPQFSNAQQQLVASIESDPLARLAVTSINAANKCRDISLRAAEESEVKTEVAAMEGEAKETVKEIAKAVFRAEDMAGVTGPMGFFDPLGYSTNTPQGKMLFYREVELKHGRVCMLATLGILVGESFHPLFGGNIDVPAYVAFQQTPLQTFWPAVVAAIAIPEIYSVFSFKEPDNDGNFWMIKEDHMPGDLGYDPLGLKPTDPKELKEMQTKELNNGRLAMIATAGMIAQELVSGQKILA